MNNEVCVSIICTAFNHEKYIRDALIGFVSQQTNFKYEAIIFDDCSTDGTRAIIKEFEINYPSIIRPIYMDYNTFSDPARFFKFILPTINGKYVALCEGDDYWIRRDKLQKQYDFMTRNPYCSLVATGAYIDNLNTGKRIVYPSNYNQETYKIDSGDLITNPNQFPTASMFFRTDFYSNNFDFLIQHKSFDYLVKTLLAIEGDVYIIPELMVVYRKGTNGSWTRIVSYNKEKSIEHSELALQQYKDVKEYYKGKFEDSLNKEIRIREFQLLRLHLDIKTMKSEKYSDLYRTMKLKTKILLYVERYIPRLYTLYKTVRKMS